MFFASSTTVNFLNQIEFFNAQFLFLVLLEILPSAKHRSLAMVVSWKPPSLEQRIRKRKRGEEGLLREEGWKGELKEEIRRRSKRIF